MNSNIIYGLNSAKQILTKVKNDIKLCNTAPKLTTILIGDDPASKLYVTKKHQACSKVNMLSQSINLPKDVTNNQALKIINELNADHTVHGIMLQLPLPAHLDKNLLINAIDAKKDVDGITAFNLGLLAQGKANFMPCTVAAIKTIAKEHNINFAPGTKVLIIGSSIIVGLPLSIYLINKQCSVAVCNKFTKSLDTYIEHADIIVSATGVHKVIKKESIRQNHIIFDIGINKLENKIVGDIFNKEEAFDCKYITAVPGGIGPLTVAHLISNTYLAYTKTQVT